MKAKRYDYSGFSLRRLGDPRFSHVKLLAGWIVYFALYFLTENLIPVEKCRVIHCALDDLIPFNEYFLLFYVSWFALVAGSLAYTLFFDVPSFRKLQIFLIVTQLVAMAVYIVYPNMQDLRPVSFPRDNFLTRVMAFIYAFDTPTGVCPSLHVAYSMGILSVGLKSRMKAVWKALLTVLVIMISISVCFVKQHSAVDVLAALPLSLLAEIIAFGKDYWLPKLRGKAAGN